MVGFTRICAIVGRAKMIPHECFCQMLDVDDNLGSRRTDAGVETAEGDAPLRREIPVEMPDLLL